MVDFCYVVREKCNVDVSVDECSACYAKVDINAHMLLYLMEDMIADFDMLTAEERENLTDLAGQILDISNE